MSLSPEEIEKNWLKFRSLCEKTGDRSKALLDLVDTLDTRLCLCPASSRKDFHNAFEGGLIDHSLRVLGNALRLQQAMGWKLPKESLIIGCLFHDLGKVGDLSNDYYLPQTDAWKIEKYGDLYVVNKEIAYMSVPDQSVFLLQHFGVRLTRDEFLAIKLNDGFVIEENRQYCLKEPLLAHVVMTADYYSTMQEKGAFP